MSQKSVDPGDPYRSARDLPSVAEMIVTLDGLEALTTIMAQQLAPDIQNLRRQVEEHVEAVDAFYDVLGSWHWILHESLDLEIVKQVGALPPEEAEHRLIERYQDPAALDSMIRRIRNQPAMRSRNHMLERAKTDFLERRHYSVVLVLLAVMDGFANDLHPRRRRGLHTRAPDEMAAWDSIVGHHLGITNAHHAFVKGFYKTSDKEVHELYRNGIVHGMLTNFDNEIVAAKAWNRLFAVGDWAASLEKPGEPLTPLVSFGDLITTVRETEKLRAELDAWSPRRLHPGDDDFANHPVHHAAEEFLKAWQGENYGEMARQLAPCSIGYDEHVGKAAGLIRGQYEIVQLESFEIIELDFVAASICVVKACLTTNAAPEPAWLRWIHEDPNGAAIIDDGDGTWKVMSWGPLPFFDAPEPAGE